MKMWRCFIQMYFNGEYVRFPSKIFRKPTNVIFNPTVEIKFAEGIGRKWQNNLISQHGILTNLLRSNTLFPTINKRLICTITRRAERVILTTQVRVWSMGKFITVVVMMFNPRQSGHGLNFFQSHDCIIHNRITPSDYSVTTCWILLTTLLTRQKSFALRGIGTPTGGNRTVIHMFLNN